MADGPVDCEHLGKIRSAALFLSSKTERALCNELVISSVSHGLVNGIIVVPSSDYTLLPSWLLNSKDGLSL